MKILIADDLAGCHDALPQILQRLLSADQDENLTRHTPLRILLASLAKLGTSDADAQRASPELAAQPELASEIMDAIGAELMHLGYVDKAAPFVEAALAGRIALYGQDHPITAQSLNTHARLKRLQGDNVQAEADVRRALFINSRIYGIDSYATVANLTELTAIQLQAGEFDQAEKSAQRGLDILETLYLDTTEPNATRLQDGLARVYQTKGEYERAAEIYQRILFVDLKQMGSKSLKYATHLANYGAVLLSQGKLQEAADYYGSAIEVYEKASVRAHPDLIDVRAAYASVLEAQGNAGAARSQLDEVIAIDLKVRGEHHLYVGNDYVRRGHAVYSLGYLDAARDDFQRGLAIYLKNVKKDRISAHHVFIAEARAWIARTLVEQAGADNRERIGAEAEPFARDAFESFQASFADDSVEVAIASAILGRVLALQNKDVPRARSLLAQALPIVTNARGPNEKITQLIRAWLEEVACA